MNTSMNQASLVLLMSSPDPGSDAAATHGAGTLSSAIAAASLVLARCPVPDPGKRDAAAYALHGGTIDASAAASLVLLMTQPRPRQARRRCAPPACRSMSLRLPRRWSC